MRESITTIVTPQQQNSFIDRTAFLKNNIVVDHIVLDVIFFITYDNLCKSL